jgi:DNA-binding NarL/FixJ family response regulator
MTIRLVLADDHPLVIKGLELLFATEPDFAVLAYCADGEQALQAVRQLTPDILVLDLRLPGQDGLAVLRELRRENQPVKVVILTGELSEEEALEAIRLGVRGVVLKEMAPQLLLQCLRKVQAGEAWLEKRSFGRALDRMLEREAGMRQVAGLLTPREIELVRLVAKGLDNRRIADALYISEGTVKVHLHHVFAKLGIRNRLALTLYAQEKGIDQLQSRRCGDDLGTTHPTGKRSR